MNMIRRFYLVVPPWFTCTSRILKLVYMIHVQRLKINREVCLLKADLCYQSIELEYGGQLKPTKKKRVIEQTGDVRLHH